MKELTEESRKANKLKRDKPVLAILGNPPYSGTSANKGEWITNLLKDGYERADGSRDDGYYTVDGEPLEEQQSKWLHDDYVKFIRFAQWKIDQTGEGVVGYITNHNYLDNPTFRGMRESLLDSFDRIFIVNLHGNSLKQESPPGGGEDENVFDIRPGVAIAIFVKNDKFDETKVFYTDVWGKRERKLQWLDRRHPGIDNAQLPQWQEVTPQSPNYYLVPRNQELQEKYNSFWKLKDIFQKDNSGIQTGRDNLTICWTEEEVWETVTKLIELSPEDAREEFDLPADSSNWQIKWAQDDLEESGPTKEKITPILYRPFDTRFTYYTGNSSGFHSRPGSDVMKQMAEKENISLCVGRQGNVVGSPIYDVMFVTDKIVDLNLFRRGGEIVFPLWRYGEKQQNLAELDEKNGEKDSNFNPRLLSELQDRYGEEPEPRALFSYLYAVLQSLKYRKMYADFLDTNFPRIPFPDDKSTFEGISSLGDKLIELHLMNETRETETKFDVRGSNEVTDISFAEGKLFINEEQFFDNVPEEIWEFHVGGYQVLEKWLKYRKGQKLSASDVEHIMQIIEVLKETIRLRTEIDEKMAFI